MKNQFRTAVLTIAAVLSLGGAAAMAAQKAPWHSPGRPSTTPPPWSHGGDHGKAGEDHGKSGDDHGKSGHGHGKSGDDRGRSGRGRGR